MSSIGKTVAPPPPRVRQTCIAVCQALGITAGAVILSNAVAAETNVFTLGEITVTAKGENEVSPLAPATLDNEQLQDFDRNGLPDALNLIPGVSVKTGSGQRNEPAISVRGFNWWQIPLLLDGIRLYLPADNRIDFDRFLTPDLAKIEVSKGYVSVLNGPDGMGGAINLVTRKPVKPFEGEVRASAAFSDNGHYNGNTLYANLGSRQETTYFQASVEQRDVRGFYVSDKFKSTPYQGSGDKRANSDKKDVRVSLKAGYTPNATDEYSVNFVKQEGEKNRAFAANAATTNNYWKWPVWDVWSLYFLSRTQLGEKSYLKARVYYNKFDNELVPYTNSSFTTKTSKSTYDDAAYGASVELGTDLIDGHTIKGSLQVRRDKHTEWDFTYASGFTEPKQHNNEDVYSAALEETWHVTPKIDLVFGLSRDFRHTLKAEEFRSADSPNKFNLPISDSQATNYQTAAIWRYRDTGSAHFSISDRTRFPTSFERYSTRFGGAISNPWLKPERAVNIELGVQDRLTAKVAGSAAIFHSKIDDKIESVPYVSPSPYAGQSQNQNIGKATYKGFELGITATPLDTLEIGANYTYIDTKVHNPQVPTARLSTAPRHKGFLYAKWQATPLLTVIPSLELSASRWAYDSSTASSPNKKTGSYELLGLKIDYKLAPRWNVSFSGHNLLDKNYEYTPGYPQEGRNFLLSTSYQF
ncbi:MAG: TonB-dependent receptor [Candidatus Accumulibacter sp.]|jgi:iron complex outermembrane receptor protein|nr:TonB-dependent receptor [Accumulibacter sp.]